MKLSSTDKGALVGAANMFTVAVCCGIMTATGTPIDWPLFANLVVPLEGLALGAMVVGMAMLPVLVAGWAFGWLADHLHGTPRVRYVQLAIASLGTVAFFGAVVSWLQLIPLAAIPTLVWTWHLERWTRHRDRLPAARTA